MRQATHECGVPLPLVFLPDDIWEEIARNITDFERKKEQKLYEYFRKKRSLLLVKLCCLKQES